MTLTPDAQDIAPPTDPGAYRRTRLLGPAFWIAIVFGLVCVVAGFAFGRYWPKLFPPAEPAPAVRAVGAIGPEPFALPGARPAAPAVRPADAPAAPAAESGAAQARIDKLESASQHTRAAAAAALAASALADAAATSRPFPEELASLRRLSPELPELGAIARLAETGAPSRAALAASFADVASRAAYASRQPETGASLMRRLGYALSQIVIVRRVGDAAGSGPDALIARAEQRAGDGDLEGAVAAIDRLPAPARATLEDWRGRAERRIELDRRIAALRSRAIGELAADAAPARSGG